MTIAIVVAVLVAARTVAISVSAVTIVVFGPNVLYLQWFLVIIIGFAHTNQSYQNDESESKDKLHFDGKVFVWSEHFGRNTRTTTATMRRMVEYCQVD